MQHIIGQQIKILRAKENLKQMDFARRIGLSQVSVSAIENGGNCSNETVEKIVREFQVDRDWLLYGKEDLKSSQVHISPEYEKSIQNLEKQVKWQQDLIDKLVSLIPASALAKLRGNHFTLEVSPEREFSLLEVA